MNRAYCLKPLSRETFSLSAVFWFIATRGRKKVSNPEPINPEAKEISAELREIVPLNPQIQAEALKYALAEVKAAIAHYQKSKQKKEIENPQGWLTDCLRGKWWLAAHSGEAKGSESDLRGFNEWLDWATKQGLARGGMKDRDGKLHVVDTNAVLVPFEAMLAKYPVEMLRGEALPHVELSAENIR